MQDRSVEIYINVEDYIKIKYWNWEHRIENAGLRRQYRERRIGNPGSRTQDCHVKDCNMAGSPYKGLIVCFVRIVYNAMPYLSSFNLFLHCLSCWILKNKLKCQNLSVFLLKIILNFIAFTCVVLFVCHTVKISTNSAGEQLQRNAKTERCKAWYGCIYYSQCGNFKYEKN